MVFDQMPNLKFKKRKEKKLDPKEKMEKAKIYLMYLHDASSVP